MLKFFLRRSVGGLVILFLISAFTFFIFFAIPQNPALLACGKNCTPENVALIEKQMGLDQPIPVQFWEFMKGIVAGRSFDVGHCDAPCFGVSFNDQRMVWDTIIDRLPLTVSLTLGGLVVFLTLGIGAGMIAARKKGTLIDKSFSSASLVLSSLQIYFIGPIVVGLLVYSTGLLPAPEYVPFTENLGGWFIGLLIPWFVMSLIFTANYTRMSRSTLIEQLQEDHVRTARAKGMSGKYVFFRYAWRGSLTPIVTILGIDLGALLGGAIVTETTFSLAGLGRLVVDSVNNKDLPMTMGVMLFASAFILLLNILVDFVYGFIDPRVRLA
ncbi:ABC transporter permease [Streptomyces sp. RKND-216]|uniref:ABC transporter permease n=1 Tax=Streptomyces hazeniae TaxID=3075538 RepID=A0ABU2NLW3_9ACTN|nr:MULTISPECIES: ABC transporter permease [unclassified Streptomyces]MDT0377971.1 ABC transporter permease [Streptomyces sp. DSM 42041]THA24678.1 ABC transporter permease [Streptomyces sp. RKND-216]